MLKCSQCSNTEKFSGWVKVWTRVYFEPESGYLEDERGGVDDPDTGENDNEAPMIVALTCEECGHDMDGATYPLYRVLGEL